MNRALMILALGLAAVVLGDAAAHAEELSPVEQRRTLVGYLGGCNYRPSRKVLDRLGPDIDVALIHIAADVRERPTVRGRAVAALAVYPTRRTRHYLESLLYERNLFGTATGTLLRRQALRSLGLGFGDAVVPTVAALREDPDPQIREACAHALGDTASLRAVRVLEAWLPNEPELAVRSAVDQALDQLRTRGSR